MFYWIMKTLIAGPLLRLIWRPWAKGRENIPKTGPVILASNHLAVIDSFFMPIMLRRRVLFLGKSEYVSGRGIKGRFVAWFMLGVGLIPVDRTSGRASEAALATGLAKLNEGEIFCLYPEGTRSPDGRLYRGKTGVARLALESGAPVIPVAMFDTNVAQPIGQVFPKVMRIGMEFGKPIDLSQWQGKDYDRATLRAVTDKIMSEIQEISGQEYVDTYAATRKAQLAAGPGQEQS